MVGALHPLLLHLALVAIARVTILVVARVLAGLHLLLRVDLVRVVAAARVACVSHCSLIASTYLLNLPVSVGQVFFKFILINKYRC